ncbi:Wee1-like protein kinase [Tanacetum coccineum]
MDLQIHARVSEVLLEVLLLVQYLLQFLLVHHLPNPKCRQQLKPSAFMINRFIKDALYYDGYRPKPAVFSPPSGDDSLSSRYITEFHEIKRIGTGSFGNVFKALNQFDGCMYAVKISKRELNVDAERQRVGDLLEAMHQIAKVLQFVHEKGIVHLDIKPENIFVKSGVYKLGDFGCAALTDGSMDIYEGDGRYVPPEILQENYSHLDKADIFSFGATFVELASGSKLENAVSDDLRKWNLPPLPNCSVRFHEIVKAMVDPDPESRPSAKDLVVNPIFHRPSVS